MPETTLRSEEHTPPDTPSGWWLVWSRVLHRQLDRVVVRRGRETALGAAESVALRPAAQDALFGGLLLDAPWALR
eukprot:7389351-Prymnesium_polylepis.1